MNYEKIFESQYDCDCDIFEYRKVTNENFQTTTQLEKVISKAKCRLLYKTFPESSEGVVSGVLQQVKLLISPSYSIKEGSVIVVTRGENIETYENSGKPAMYKYHQEINLIASDKYA